MKKTILFVLVGAAAMALIGCNKAQIRLSSPSTSLSRQTSVE